MGRPCSRKSAGGSNTRIQHDPSGEITRALTELIEQGHTITRRLATLAQHDAVNGQGKTIGNWRIACLQTLHAGFAREAAIEFLHTSDPTTLRRRKDTTVESHTQHMNNALALLHVLKGTLERRDQVTAPRHADEPRGVGSQAARTLPSEKLAPSRH